MLCARPKHVLYGENGYILKVNMCKSRNKFHNIAIRKFLFSHQSLYFSSDLYPMEVEKCIII